MESISPECTPSYPSSPAGTSMTARSGMASSPLTARRPLASCGRAKAAPSLSSTSLARRKEGLPSSPRLLARDTRCDVLICLSPSSSQFRWLFLLQRAGGRGRLPGCVGILPALRCERCEGHWRYHPLQRAGWLPQRPLFPTWRFVLPLLSLLLCMIWLTICALCSL